MDDCTGFVILQLRFSSVRIRHPDLMKEQLYNFIHIDNLSYEEIGRRLNMSGNGVKKLALRLGIELPKRRKINPKENFNKSVSNRTINLCLNCDKETTNQKYCSQKCQQDHKYQLWVIDWKMGDETGITGDYGISSYLRRFLLEKFHNKCSNCGWNKVNQYTGNSPLEIEHIDGNYSNNNEDNLTILCPNCHSLTSTYKGANKGFGRKERSKYN